MDIQSVSLDDLDGLVLLAREMRRESEVHFPEIDPAAIEAHLALVAEHPDRVFMAVGRDAERPVGLVSGVVGDYAFSRVLRGCCDILFVSPGFRGRHAGLRLLRAFTDWADMQGARSIYLGVSTGIAPARTARLLERAGYAPLGQTFRKEIISCVPE